MTAKKQYFFTCPHCGSPSRVVDSRHKDNAIRRRRECENGHRFRTYETIDTRVFKYDLPRAHSPRFGGATG